MDGGCGLRGCHGVHMRYAQRHYTWTLTPSSWSIEMFTSRLRVFCKIFVVANLYQFHLPMHKDVANAELTLNSHFLQDSLPSINVSIFRLFLQISRVL